MDRLGPKPVDGCALSAVRTRLSTRVAVETQESLTEWEQREKKGTVLSFELVKVKRKSNRGFGA